MPTEDRNKPAQVDLGGGFEKDRKIVGDLARHQLKYSMAGLVVGVICIVGGIVLLALGVSGQVTWTTEVPGAKSVLKDAAPGVVLIVVGFLVVFVTRFSVKAGK